MTFHRLLFKTISACGIPCSCEGWRFLGTLASPESADKEASFRPSLDKAILLPLEKVPTTFVLFGAADSWWWQKLKSHWIQAYLEGEVSCHATPNGTSSDGAYKSLTLFPEFLLPSANRRRHVKMTKAGSMSKRSLWKSEDDTSWENAAWNIAMGTGMRFENPDVIFSLI